MKRYIIYFKYVVRHKWFVFLACRKTGVSLWQAIIHDASKFSPLEFITYAKNFYNPDGSNRKDAYDLMKESLDYKYAWNHHEKNNKHHFGYWVVSSNDDGKPEVLPMPIKYIREMVADWAGAGKAINGHGNPYKWYADHGKKFLLHKDTREYLEIYLNQLNVCAIFYEWF